jgi:Zn-dependent protease with chaperone function
MTASSPPQTLHFAGPIQRVRIGFGYRVGILLAAVVMIALPLLYVGVIVGFGWLIWLHLTHDAGMVKIASGRAGLFLVLLYIAPLIAGMILLAFMVKPLFARRVRRGGRPLEVTRAEEPRLFELVDRLCAVVGAPQPARINVDVDVNASASFNEGFAGWLRKDLVLTIGLPLAAGLTARQFVGVLAHEFGHFAQGSSMRLTYVVRSINAWFARVVYERDAWDAWLATAGRSDGDTHGSILIIILLTRLFMWVTRRILWVLMLVGHAVSAFLLRQMEFDADRYETRVAGSVASVATFARLRTLSLATHAALSDLQTAWQEKRLPDDLPMLIAAREQDMPDKLRAELHAPAGKRATGLLDTHPCDGERITSIRRENCDGVFTDDAPAAALFTDFAELSKLATIKFYQDQLGKLLQPEHVVPTETLVRHRGERRESHAALNRYFAGLLRPLSPVFPESAIVPIKHRATAAERLLELRGRFVELANTAAPLLKQTDAADDRLIAVRHVRALRYAGVKRIDVKELKLPGVDDDTLRTVEREAKRQQTLNKPAVEKALSVGMQRLELALAMVDESAPKALSSAATDSDDGEYSLQSDARPGQLAVLLDALTALRSIATNVDSLRYQLVGLAALLPECTPENRNDSFIGAVLSASRHAVTDLESMRQTLGASPYPYEHGHQSLTVAQFLISGRHAANEVGAVASVAQSALESYYTLYARLMADLAHRAEQVEVSLGLETLPEPAVDDAK